MTRTSPKSDVQALEPLTYSKAFWEITGQRIFYVSLGNRTLGRGTSAHGAWEMALKNINKERERIK